MISLTFFRGENLSRSYTGVVMAIVSWDGCPWANIIKAAHSILSHPWACFWIFSLGLSDLSVHAAFIVKDLRSDFEHNSFSPSFQLSFSSKFPSYSWSSSYMNFNTSYLISPRIPFWYFYWDHMKLIGSLPLTVLWRQESENMVYFSIVLLCPLVALKLQTINLTYFLISSIQEGFFLLF